jgi:hypothetical protein
VVQLIVDAVYYFKFIFYRFFRKVSKINSKKEEIQLEEKKAKWDESLVKQSVDDNNEVTSNTKKRRFVSFEDLEKNYDKTIEIINDQAAESIETEVTCFRSGFYQIISFIFISLAWTVSLGLYGYLDVFGGYTPEYECDIPSSILRNQSITVIRSEDECSYNIYENLTGFMTTYDCDSWNYDDTFMKDTKITEYDFVCEKNYVFETAYSVEQMGYVVGTLIFSIYADRLGRKPVFIFVLLAMTILGFIQFFMKNFYAYTAIGFFINIFATGINYIFTIYF